MKRIFKTIAVIAGVVILGCAAFIAIGLYGNWSAERRARAFCEAIPIGSDISAATARAKEDKVLWGSDRFYTFYFPGTFFDKAICDVETDQQGKVAKRGSRMLYD